MPGERLEQRLALLRHGACLALSDGLDKALPSEAAPAAAADLLDQAVGGQVERLPVDQIDAQLLEQPLRRQAPVADAGAISLDLLDRSAACLPQRDMRAGKGEPAFRLVDETDAGFGAVVGFPLVLAALPQHHLQVAVEHAQQHPRRGLLERAQVAIEQATGDEGHESAGYA